MTIPEAALAWAKKIADDPRHGYSQASRWGKEGTVSDFDCSSFVISAYEQAGAGLKSAGATYTGDLRGVALRCGFSDVTAKCNLNNCSGMQPGDILLYHISGTNGHAAMYAGNSKIVHARGKSYGAAAPGDQGTEIAVTNYSRSKWQYVLRYTGSKAAVTSPAKVVKRYDVSTTLPIIKYGSRGRAVAVWQQIVGVETDGEFGQYTMAATLAFQRAYGLEDDGEVGPYTWSAGFKTVS